MTSKEAFLLHVPSGKIQARIARSPNKVSSPNIALLLDAHSSPSGSTKDSALDVLSKVLVEKGYCTLSINCTELVQTKTRDQSKISRQEDVEALEDGAAALDWLEKQVPEAKFICVAGFSFGSWIAMELTMRRPEVSNFISISPPVERYDFAPFIRFPLRGLIVQGEMDSVTEEKTVRDFFWPMVESRASMVRYEKIELGDHFLRGKSQELENITQAYLDTLMDELQLEHSKVKKAKYTRSKNSQ